MSEKKSSSKAEKKAFSAEGGIYDARSLGIPKMLILGLQHMFAMFGATVLVPAITGLSVSATLLFAGIGTLLFHLLSKRKVPAFLGSSFAFLGGYAAVKAAESTIVATEAEKLPYACIGVACAGLLYLVLAGLIKIFGAKKVMKFFPPIVTGPIIIAIGLTLSKTAIDSCSNNWWIALAAIVVVIVCNIWGKGMIKIIPIILGVIASYIVAFGIQIYDVAQVMGTGAILPFLQGTLDTTKAEINVIFDFAKINQAAWIGLPVQPENTVFAIFKNPDVSLIVTSIITIMPIALATMVEHIGDISAISNTTGKNYIADPGLHRTLLGDGLATILASIFGAPANTTYGENTGVLSLTKVYDPRVIRIAAYFAIAFSFSPKFAAVVSSIPVATCGGVSLVLYGMISAVGVRNIVENKVDFAKSRNVIIAALILVLSIGINYSTAGAIAFSIGKVTISLSGLAVGALVGILLNAILPGKDYEFGKDEKGDTSVNFEV